MAALAAVRSGGLSEFDLAVIGAGSGGLSVAAVAAQLGLRVALIERDRMGGDCLNTGCVPSKALLAAAHAAADARDAGRLGLRIAAPEVDWSAVQRHVHGVIATLAPADSVERFSKLGATVLLGEARFVTRDTLAIAGAVGERRLTARRIVVAAGSRASIPALPGLNAVDYLTHETLFDLPQPPSHLLILGGGAIGLEMAQAHVELGCRVTIVERGRLGGREDRELMAVLADALTRACVDVVTDAQVVRVEPGPALLLADGRRIRGSHLLIAIGRTPNLERLDLPTGGVRATERGIATDLGLRSPSNRRVFAVGDIADPQGIGPRYLTHAASHDAGIVIRQAVFRVPARVSATMPRVIYTAPELAQVGLTEAEARAAGSLKEVLRWPLADNDRAQTERRTAGLVKLVVGRRGRILGAGIAAPHAGEMIGAWTLAVTRRIPLAAMAELIVPYPTLAEAGRRAAGSGFARRLFARSTRRAVWLLAMLP